MAIPCPECGREYDVTLFQFGRTIHCTCGARVGLEKRIGADVSVSDPRFLVDAMLGGLARWLRILGFDAAFDPTIPDENLVRRSLEEGRQILTRDRRLREEWTVSNCTVLESEDLEEQLQEIVARFSLREKVALFSRCPLCNMPLKPLPGEEARARVPPGVHERQDSFLHCPECGQVYWEGSHTERIRRRLHKVLEGRR